MDKPQRDQGRHLPRIDSYWLKQITCTQKVPINFTYLDLPKGAKWFLKGVNLPSLRVWLAPGLEGAGMFICLYYVHFSGNESQGSQLNNPYLPPYAPLFATHSAGDKISQGMAVLAVSTPQTEWAWQRPLGRRWATQNRRKVWCVLYVFPGGYTNSTESQIIPSSSRLKERSKEITQQLGTSSFVRLIHNFMVWPAFYFTWIVTSTITIADVFGISARGASPQYPFSHV